VCSRRAVLLQSFLFTYSCTPKIQDRIGLLYKNSRELNKTIDLQLPGLPSFQCKEVKIDGQSFEIHFHNPIKCIEALFSDPEFSDELLLVPEWQFLDETKAEQWFHEMNTGQWWWQTQVFIRLFAQSASG
jgi:hypothetical protein